MKLIYWVACKFLLVNVLVTFLLLSSSDLIAQNGQSNGVNSTVKTCLKQKLTLVKGNGKERSIPKWKTIRVSVEKGKAPITGKYEVLDSLTIMVDGVEIAIADIEKISGLNWPIVFTPALILGGGIGLGYGGLLAYFGAYWAYVGWGVAVLIAGVGVVGVSAVGVVAGSLILYHSKTYNVGEKWEIVSPAPVSSIGASFQ